MAQPGAPEPETQPRGAAASMPVQTPGRWPPERPSEASGRDGAHGLRTDPASATRADPPGAIGPDALDPDALDRADALDDGKPADHCGIVAVAAKRPVASYLYYALQALQHRGQESAGIVTLDGLYEFRQHKGMGLVDQVFNPKAIERMRGHHGIGHVRYSTSAGSTEEAIQPQVVMGAGGGIALGHNGNIPNVADLMEELQEKGWAFYTGNDTEVVVRLLANKLRKHEGDAVQAITSLMDRLQGAYCFTIMIGSQLFAVRDPWGIKPLCAGRMPDGGNIVASESVALDVVGATWVRDIEPGEVVRITADTLETVARKPAPNAARCFFEYVYFARGDSFMDGRLNQTVRENIGKVLWQEAPVDADMVVPVPDSGRSHARGLADTSGLPYVEALMKNRYVHRTFIMPTQESRELNVRLKINPVKQVVQGKKIILVDDSIVRGTTMRRIVAMLKQAGAKEVHLRIGAPPIVAPCYLGIDMSTRDQLIAANNSVEQVRQHVGADSLAYITIPGIQQALAFDESELCVGCVTGRYPVLVPGEKDREGNVNEGVSPDPHCC